MDFSQVVIIGGGPAGFFASIVLKELAKACSCTILEASDQPLAKLRATGGGRANITNSIFEPEKLKSYYPRGSKELLGPLSRFGPKETIMWFEKHGTRLKTEPDGRVFPASNSSQTIVDMLLQMTRNLGIAVLTQKNCLAIEKKERFHLTMADGSSIACGQVLVATGGSRTINKLIENFGHTIVPQIPSLFAFRVPASPLADLSGITLEKVSMKMFRHEASGPLLLTHFGFAGPAILTLSSLAARELFETDYKARLEINWLPDMKQNEIERIFREARENSGTSIISTHCPFCLPQNLWKRFLELLAIPSALAYTNLSNAKMSQLAQTLSSTSYDVTGRATHKGEFVTSGGVKLDEVNFKTMESKLVQGLYFAGEVLDIDAVTGGFNLQNCWTSGWIAAHAIAAHLDSR